MEQLNTLREIFLAIKGALFLIHVYVLPMEYNVNQSAVLQYRPMPPVTAPRQTYSVHRDGQLIASNQSSLSAVKKFIRADARIEKWAGRSASYTLTGTLGYRRIGEMINGTVHWE